MSKGSLDSELVNDAGGAFENSPETGRHVQVFLNFVDRRMALPSAAFRARLNDTVIAGN